MALTYSVPDTELSLTLHNRRAEVIDNIFTGTSYMNAMTRFGGVRTESGGLELHTPLLFSKSTAVGPFSGFDTLDTTPQENETTARYPWAMYYATVSLSWDEITNNEGVGKLIDITNQKIDDAMMSLKDRINIDLMQAQPSAGNKSVASLTEIIDEAPSADPARTASIGSIANSNTWWRNQATSGGAFTVADMNAMWNDVSDGVENPTFLFTHSTPFEYYENSLTGQIRYGDTSSADAGFTNLLYKSAPMFWDTNLANTDEIYFINTKYLKITMKSGADFVTTDFIEPANQAARTAKILVKLQQESNNRRRLGTLHGLTAPA